MLTCIDNHQSFINSKTKPNESIPNIDEHNKQTPYFQGSVLCHALVVCCLMMARCIVQSMIRGYHEYICKLSLESELDLLKYCNINILTYANQIEVHLMLLHVPHVKKTGKLAKIFWQIGK